MKICFSKKQQCLQIIRDVKTMTRDLIYACARESQMQKVAKTLKKSTYVCTYIQGCILLTYLSVTSSKVVQKFDQKCQYFTLIDQSVPLDNFYITFYLRTNQLCIQY